jgi:hypothetical protein
VEEKSSARPPPTLRPLLRNGRGVSQKSVAVRFEVFRGNFQPDWVFERFVNYYDDIQL